MSKNLWVAILAAGESQRFKDAGFHTPKPYLRIKDKNGIELSMINHVIKSLRKLGANIIVGIPGLILPPSDLNVERAYIENTKGQADTAFQVLRHIPDEDQVLILDCDMILKADDITKMIHFLKTSEVVVAVAETFDPNASRVDTIPFPTRFAEKEPISHWGIVGARAFANVGNLKTALATYLMRAEKINREPYLSEAMNLLEGTKYAHLITEFQDWGTPERIRESGAEII